MITLAHGALPGTPIWLPHNISITAAILLGAFFYTRITSRRGAGAGPAVPRIQRVSFSLGLIALWLSLDGPIEALSGSLYIAHMSQHILLTLVAPPLLICGLTPRMFRTVLVRTRLLGAVKVLGRPIPALLLFNGTLAISHAPDVVRLMLESAPFHYAVHAALLATALLMWLPVTSPIPEVRKLNYPARMCYILIQSVVPTIPASFLTFGSEPLYPVYNSLAPQWGMTALMDQQIAGLIMKIGGGLILFGIVAVLFARWASEESREAAARRASRQADVDADSELPEPEPIPVHRAGAEVSDPQ